VIKFLRQACSDPGASASTCTGAFVLAEAGLSTAAATTIGIRPRIAGSFPKSEGQEDNHFHHRQPGVDLAG